MCGRFTQTISAAAVSEAFSVKEITSDLKPSYNIAPTQSVAAKPTSIRSVFGWRPYPPQKPIR